MKLSSSCRFQVTSLGGPSLATIKVSPRLSLETRILLSKYTVSNLQTAAGQYESPFPAHMRPKLCAECTLASGICSEALDLVTGFATHDV